MSWIKPGKEKRAQIENLTRLYTLIFYSKRTAPFSVNIHTCIVKMTSAENLATNLFEGVYQFLNCVLHE